MPHIDDSIIFDIVSQMECFNVLQLLCLIGESFEHSDDINGAVVNIRPRGDKICK